MSAAKKCPLCERPAVEAFRPFCSKRCADLDLGQWLKGGYAIPAEEDPEDEASLPTDDGDDDASPGGGTTH